MKNGGRKHFTFLLSLQISFVNLSFCFLSICGEGMFSESRDAVGIPE